MGRRLPPPRSYIRRPSYSPPTHVATGTPPGAGVAPKARAATNLSYLYFLEVPSPHNGEGKGLCA